MSRFIPLLTFLIIVSFSQSAAAWILQNNEEENSDDRISINELKRKLDRKEKIVIIDARDGNSYLGSSVKIKTSIHIIPDQLEARMSELPKNREIVIYCT